ASRAVKKHITLIVFNTFIMPFHSDLLGVSCVISLNIYIIIYPVANKNVSNGLSFLQLSSPFTPLRSPASPKPPKSLSPSNNPSPPLSKSKASLAEKDPELNSSIISSSSTSSSEPATNLLSKNFSRSEEHTSELQS